MKRKITVHKLDSEGNEVWSYQGWVLDRSESHVILEAFFDREDQIFYGVALRRGDRFEEIYYRDRWYNIFRIFDVESQAFKGWYCNIARPASLNPKHIFAEDLALDLLVKPEGQWILLDQEEFDQLNLPDKDREQAYAALEELKQLIKIKGGFFSDPS